MNLRDSFPQMTVQRGGIVFPQPGSPEWARAQRDHEMQEVVARYINRLVGDTVRAQNAAVDTALLTSRPDESVHVYDPPWDHRPPAYERMAYRFIGIAIEPGRRVVYWHHYHRGDPW